MAIYDINGNVISAGNAALPFVGKKVVCFGDSIWAYNVGSGKLPEIIQANMGGAWYACAVGGTRMTPTHENDYAMVSATALADAIATGNWTNVNSALNGDTVTNSAVIKNAFSKVQALDFSTDVAMIVFAFGTNDFSSGQAWEDETDKNDVIGAMKYIEETIHVVYPGVKIVFTSTHRYTTSGGDGYGSTNSNGTVDDLFAAMQNEAEKLSCPFIDILHNLNISENTRSTITTDGVHLSELGHTLYADVWCAQLLSKTQGMY